MVEPMAVGEGGNHHFKRSRRERVAAGPDVAGRRRQGVSGARRRTLPWRRRTSPWERADVAIEKGGRASRLRRWTSLWAARTSAAGGAIGKEGRRLGGGGGG
ncbi:hypothetical protein NL676_021573 [Syzygium grande]|nr:hypothetical protein NL676_021573 [Syzygium grande]